MRALSIRQPYADEILSGAKHIEYRSRPTRIIGERFHIYASRGEPTEKELLEFSGIFENLEELREARLPVGMIIGSAIITACSPPTSEMPYWHWHLGGVRRNKRLRKPKGHPQPVWFRPF